MIIYLKYEYEIQQIQQYLFTHSLRGFTRAEIFFCGENHFTEGNRDWFGGNNIPSVVRDVIFPKPVEIPRGKVIFPGKKITSQVNHRNE